VGERPFFVVGCPRSGTTLLKHMLEGHPRLAIPYESHFVVAQAPSSGPVGLARRPAPSVDTILAHPCVQRWDVAPEILRARVAAAAPTTYPDLVAAVFEAYAAAHEKPRWGDKTPGYVMHLPLLERMFPDAQFVHVVRDGREVAVSLAERPWGPASAIAGAFWWRTKAGRGVRDGRRLGRDRYCELRLEDLVDAPEEQLRRVCEFLGEEYTPAMLDYGDRVAGSDEEDDPEATIHLASGPTPGLRDWRTGRPPREAHAVESVCAPLLARLGYLPGTRTATGLAYAWAVRIRDLPGRVPVELRLRRSPAIRKV
jgi:sulfotransferase family protein